jgi:DNA-binding NarL/FixJ family response regulator
LEVAGEGGSIYGGKAMRILIVDDNELMRRTIRAFLVDIGHEVVGEAEDGASAVKNYIALKPEMVFLDLILPGRSGEEILEDLRKIDPKVRVVIITAVSQIEVDRKLLKKGVTAVIHKPFSYEEFKETLSRIAL